ncbi:hypothetical protein CK203_018055 [Vitis vinifera]|uniref:Myb/SANT-like domain-containing protein n=1 Tax=Vitis vinifera TaxID=29760 RepID=A0A438JVX4_VITVI|nr:hypothetical protein CK203_018055 [Vitis vinifera]
MEKLIGEERRLNAKNEKKEEEGIAHQIENSESHLISAIADRGTVDCLQFLLLGVVPSRQLKNKWSSLKKDWQLWNTLIGKETGLGWDPMRQTINASNEWWDKKLKLERICSAVENRSSISSKGDKPGCSIAEVMKIIRGMPEVKNDFELYMKATDIMVVKENRDMFVALEDPIDQIAWLKHKHV